ncbi:complex I subunit 4 family protein [Pseudonocardia acidicola]|uniref:NADH-quinone oxidoreductase subunit M n=1 Tax=Pseudonocardia acidicola TaxID=2724939 RepID=A0ABX1S7D1_9PSEU|nr:NADH-quinone oxidoreductase subunit M [Pseudonocardia acidicola]NMH97475.1 NADH-quinone oxidoreductase subunit M [Pseudonocardia acidicola]
MNVLLVLLLAVPLAGALVLLVSPRGWAQHRALPVGLAATALTLLDAVALAVHYARGSRSDVDAAWIPAIGLRFHLGVDGISLPLVLLTALLTTLCAAYLLRSAARPARPQAFVALLLLLEVGMLGTFVALDLLLFFVAFEIVLVPMYAVIAGWGGADRRPSARQFILYTLVGSGVMLVGLVLVGVAAGTLDMVVLAQRGGAGLSHTVQVVGFLAIAGGLAVKIPVWPLHSWLPDAHTAAPTVGSVLLAGVLLKMGTYGLVRIAVPILPEGAAAFAPVLGVLGVVGIVYAGLACLGQSNLKRLVAFSSIGHMGFVLLGISTLTAVGINAALFANIAHGVITGLLFFLVGGISERYGSTDMGRLGGGLLAATPRLGALVVFGAVASLGLPGLAGFWGEGLAVLAAFRPAAELPGGLYVALAAVAGVGMVLTAAYLLVMLRRVVYGVPRSSVPMPDMSRAELLTWSPLVAAVLVAGLWPAVVLGVTDGAVRALLGVR